MDTLALLPFTSADARQQLLSDLASATETLALALARLGAAYEQLDEDTSDRLEQQLFRPLQRAYARAQRTHSEFSDRHGLPRRRFDAPSPGLESQGAGELIEKAADAIGEADLAIGELQDSMLPVEVGDVELRAGLAEVRTLIDTLPARARGLVRTIGR